MKYLKQWLGIFVFFLLVSFLMIFVAGLVVISAVHQTLDLWVVECSAYAGLAVGIFTGTVNAFWVMKPRKKCDIYDYDE